MIFQVDLAFALELLAFSAGTALVVWSCREAAGRALAKLVGLLVMAASLVAMACTIYYAQLYRQAGLFEPSTAQEMSGMGKGGGMKCPMMEMMEKMRHEKSGESAPMDEMKMDEDHGPHH